MAVSPTARWRIVGRRVAVLAAAVVITVGIGNGYRSASPTLTWQMFPEASTWQAEISRITFDGRQIDVREPWTGGYEWSAMVDAGGLSTPFSERPASYGIAVALDRLQHALDWVATNTPRDDETARLVAVVTHRRNADPPQTTRLTSVTRDRE